MHLFGSFIFVVFVSGQGFYEKYAYFQEPNEVQFLKVYKFCIVQIVN